MKKYYLPVLVLLWMHLLSLHGQTVNMDSIAQLVWADTFSVMNDSLRADAFRRLSIENIRKSSVKARNYALDYLKIAKHIEQEKDEAIALNLIGVTYATAGNLEKALDYYLKSLAIRKKLGLSQMISNSMNNIGTMYVRLGQHDEGLKYYREALKIRRALGDESGKAQSLNNIGVTYKLMEQYDSALYYYEQSLAIKRRLNDKELLASSLNNLGEIALLNGDLSKAREYLEESLALRKAIDDKYGLISTYSRLSDYYLYRKEYDKALQQLQKALILSLDDFDDEDVFANPEAGCGSIDHNTVELLNKKAEIFCKLYQVYPDSLVFPEMCLDIYLHIVDLLDQMRKSYPDEKSKLYLMENNRDFFSKAVMSAINMLVETGDAKYKTVAFELAERGKASILLDQISENAAKLNLKIPDSLLKQETSLKIDIARLQQNIYELQQQNNPDIDSIRKLQNILFFKQQKFDNYAYQLETKFPRFNQLKYSRNTCSLEDVKTHLKPDELFLEYHIADTTLYIFIVTDEKNSILQIPVDSVFFRDIDVLNKFLTGGPGKNVSKVDEAYCDAAYKLYRILIQTVETWFNKRKLIIIPDGQLFYIPFEVLLTGRTGDTLESYDMLPYLIKRYPVNYSYSASMFINSLKHPASDYDKDIVVYALGFKKEHYTYNASNVNETLARRGEPLYGELTGVKDEMNGILKIVDGESFFDDRASEYRFKHPGNSYQVIHIATHGIINNENPMFSKLVFSPDTLYNEDGDLYSWELFNMKIDAGMVVLSACNTGYGKLRLGEGMMTLARGFLYAGVPSMVISLWNVSDASTVIIMKNFYTNLNLGMEKEVALQQAKLQFLADADDITANPYFWGGFIHIGNTKPLSFGQSQKATRTIIAFILLVGLTGFVWMWRSKIKNRDRTH